jgi:hypothetical protein
MADPGAIADVDAMADVAAAALADADPGLVTAADCPSNSLIAFCWPATNSWSPALSERPHATTNVHKKALAANALCTSSVWFSFCQPNNFF